MKIGLSGGYFNHPLEEQIKKFQSMPEYLLYDGLTERGHEVIPLSTSSFPFEHLDIIHCHHYSRILNYSSILKKTPVVFTPHNPFIFNPDYQLKLLDRLSLKRIDALVVLSERERQVYLHRVDYEKIHVIPNGLKVSLYEKPDKLISRLAWCIPDDKIVVLFVGQLLSYKGLKYLFKAVEGLDIILLIKSHHNPEFPSPISLLSVSQRSYLHPEREGICFQFETLYIRVLLLCRRLCPIYYSVHSQV